MSWASGYIEQLQQGDRYQIGNNIGRINGWITFTSIYGKLVNIE